MAAAVAALPVLMGCRPTCAMVWVFPFILLRTRKNEELLKVSNIIRRIRGVDEKTSTVVVTGEKLRYHQIGGRRQIGSTVYSSILLIDRYLNSSTALERRLHEAKERGEPT